MSDPAATVADLKPGDWFVWNGQPPLLLLDEVDPPHRLALDPKTWRWQRIHPTQAVTCVPPPALRLDLNDQRWSGTIGDLWKQLDLMLAALWQEHGYRGVVFGAIKGDVGAAASSVVVTGGPNLFGLTTRVCDAIRTHTHSEAIKDDGG